MAADQRAIRLEQLEQENARLLEKIERLEGRAAVPAAAREAADGALLDGSLACTAPHGLPRAAVERYSRQMILPAFGAQGEGWAGQGALRNGRPWR